MKFVDWGLIDYRKAAQRQLDLVEQIASARSAENGASSGLNDTLVFCAHPAVVTLGRATKSEDLLGWSGETVEVSRGGRATYHGPSQIVVYPILDMNLNRSGFRARDLHGYMRTLEQSIVETLGEFGIASAGGVAASEDEVSRTGVWISNGDKKIASIGIACKKWVTYHGLALNVAHDPDAFAGIQPCGMNSSIMTSMEQALGGAVVDRAAVIASLRRTLGRLLLVNSNSEA